MKKILLFVFAFVGLFIFIGPVYADVNKNYWDVCNEYEEDDVAVCAYDSVEGILKEHIDSYGVLIDDDGEGYSVVFENQINIPSTGLKMDSVDVSKNKDNSVIAFLDENNTVHIQFNGVLVLERDSSYLFNFDSSTLLSIEGLNYLDTSKVTDMEHMFYGIDATELDLSSFDTSNVVNTEYMFGLCWNLKTIYVSDLWNLSKVNPNSNMFMYSPELVGGNGTSAYDEDYGYGWDGTYATDFAVIDSKNNKGFLSYKYTFETNYYVVGKSIFVDGEFDLDNINISDNVSKSKVGNYVYITKGNIILKELEIKNINELSYLENEEFDIDTAVSNAYVELSWDESEYAEKYEIYRSTDEVNYTKIDTVTRGTYTDNDVECGNFYYYKIKAINKNYSAWGSVAEVFIDPEYPDLDTKTTSLTSVTLRWNDDEYQEYYKVDGFEIYQCSDYYDEDTCKLKKTILDPKATTYKVTGLKTAKTYYFRMKSFVVRNGKRYYSDFSFCEEVKTKLGTPEFNAKSTSTTSIKLSWSKSEGATKYQIYELVKGKYKKIKTTTGTSYTIKKLKFRSTHNYRVRALKETKSKTYYSDYEYLSIIVGITTPKVTIESTSPTSIKLTWNKVDKATKYMYGIIKTEELQEDGIYAALYHMEDYIIQGETTDTSATFDNLKLGYKYEVAVLPVDAKFDSDKEEYEDLHATYSKEFTMGPVKPTVTIKQDSVTSIKLSWTASERADSYQVYRSTKEKEGYKLVKETTDLEYIDTNVKYGTKYYYKVRTKTTLEDRTVYSAYSAIVNKATKVGKPTFTASSKSYNSNKITITAVKDATGYEIYRSTSKNGTYKKIKSTTALEYTDTKLSFNKTYYYKVRSYVTINKVKNYSKYSDIVSVKTKLNKPTFEVIYGETGATITIKKVSGATGYEIYKSSDNKAWTKWKTVKDLSKEIINTGDTENTYYKIRAYKTVSGKNVYGAYSGVYEPVKYIISRTILSENPDEVLIEPLYKATELPLESYKTIYDDINKTTIICDKTANRISLDRNETLPSKVFIELDDGTLVPALLEETTTENQGLFGE